MASTKPDLLTLTRELLRGRTIHLLDMDNTLPAGDDTWTERIRGHWWQHGHKVTRAVHRIGWSPVGGCEKSAVAMQRADAWCGDADEATTNSAFFTGSAKQVLQCYLHAAALSRQSIAAVMRWASNPDDDEAVTILQRTPGANPQWAALLKSQMNGKSRQDVYKQLNLALDIFGDPEVIARAAPSCRR